MTYTEYKSIQAKYNKMLDELADKLNSFPKYPDGRSTDEVQKRPEFMQLKKTYHFTFEQYQRFNSLKESKEYAKKMYQEKRNKYLL